MPPQIYINEWCFHWFCLLRAKLHQVISKVVCSLLIDTASLLFPDSFSIATNHCISFPDRKKKKNKVFKKTEVYFDTFE